MKNKTMKLAGLVVLLIALSFSVQAQNGGGGGGGDRMAQYRQMLKDSVQLTDVQADSVMAVQQDFRPQMMDIRRDQTMSQDDKQMKMAALQTQISARYKTFLSDDQIQKLQAMQARRMAAMRNRQGGGGGGGN